jgi:tryptophan synthase alpha chain
MSNDVKFEMSNNRTRIQQAFERSRKGLIPFITAGDPDLETTEQLLIELGRYATLIELGIPFTDPMADGPVIQRASERALKHGFGVSDVLEVVARVRSRIDTPVILFSYYNPLLQFGLDRVSREAQEAGVDGVLVTDLTPEESTEFSQYLKASGLDLIFLVAPTSTDTRIALVAKHASGFIYAVSRRGVTGQQQNLSREAQLLVNRIRRFSDLPVVVGFGVSSFEQVAEIWKYADAAVVGSAIVAEIEKMAASGDLVAHIGRFVQSLIPQIELGGNVGRYE